MSPQLPFNPFELVLVMLLSGGAGLPTGIPPGPEDPLLAKVAPPDCLAFAMWAGTAEADGTSSNQTEQLLAEPTVKAFLAQASGGVLAAMQAQQAAAAGTPAPQGNETRIKLLRAILSSPGMIYLSDLRMTPGGAPQAQGGMIVNLGTAADEVKALAAKLREEAKDTAPPIEIGQASVYRYQPDSVTPEIFWGFRGRYLLAGMSQGDIKLLQLRATGNPPTWLNDLRTQLPVPRPSITAYANLAKIVSLAVQQSGQPAAQKAVQAMGLNGLKTIRIVNGMGESGMLARAEFAFEGSPMGIRSFADGAPLTAEDVQRIPGQAPAAAVLRLDASKVFSTWMNLANQVDPQNAAQMKEGLAMAENQLGFKIEEDLLKALGDTWQVYANPSTGGLLTGWTVVVALRDRQRFEQAHAKLVALASAAAPEGKAAAETPAAPAKKGRGRPGAAGEEKAAARRPAMPSIQQTTVDGKTVFSVALPIPGLPIQPSWCITDKELVLAATPQSLQAGLNAGQAPDALGSRPEITTLFSGGKKTLYFTYNDERQIFMSLFPMMQMASKLIPSPQPAASSAKLPPADAIGRHLSTSVMAVQRTTRGLELTATNTLPGTGVGSASTFVPITLPAVQAAREAARRAQSANNLKAIGVALHSFHQVNSAFPAVCGVDATGKPLLSWRVYLLPYLNERELFQQFRFNEPWDSAANKPLIEKMPRVFQCPNLPSGEGKTAYLGVYGLNAAFTPPRQAQVPNAPPLGAPFNEFTDGSSNTLFVVEVNANSAVIWTKPEDFDAGRAKPLEALKGLRPNGFQAMFVDGSVRFIPENLPANTLKALFGRNDGIPVKLP